ncbi:hypothetical protein NA56DRAFT_645855 [Hyaloscypha hepaticicola]|uniref:Uncharacterized protein n=1 Tax=Hyaloscypha hepaticicola TaxID=2082293 RepID=A0A2J6Q4J4_9HELO|nr:hypothetical protein NA56DRAFT_645855 [Hyaloscypha hepaticicola]
MLCLITKGVHLEGYSKGKKTDDPSAARKNAYLTFATTLNDALHGTDYEHDIHKKEVTRMLDHLLLKHKAIVGKGGLAERQAGGRVTRALRLAFQRSLGAADLRPNLQPWRIPSPLDFDGSISEWNQWRRKAVEQKRRARLGLPPLEDSNDQGAAVEKVTGSPSKGNRDGQIQKPASQPGRNRWRSQQNTLSEEYVVDEVDQGKVPTMASDKMIQTNLDSFRVLPPGVRSASKYQWANPAARQPDARQQAFLGGLRGAAAIAAFQNPGAEPSQGFGEQSEPHAQLNKPRNFLAGRKSSATHARGSAKSVPGLVHDYSSDDLELFTNTPVDGPACGPGVQYSGVTLNGYTTSLDTRLTSSKDIARKQGSSTKTTLEEGEVEMGGVDEGDIWGEFDAARGLVG